MDFIAVLVCFLATMKLSIAIPLMVEAIVGELDLAQILLPYHQALLSSLGQVTQYL